MAKVYLGILRIAIGFIFLWAFLDKVFGLGFSTASERAWITGSSPTAGYLTNATHGPFADIFQSLAGNPLIDILFVVGLLGIGTAIILGVAMRLASFSGVVMMLLMYLSAFPPANNPIVDDHIIYALVLLILPPLKSAEVLGLGKKWSKSNIVKSLPFLRN